MFIMQLKIMKMHLNITICLEKELTLGIDYFLYNNLYGFGRVYYEQKDYEKANEWIWLFVKSILDNSGISF